MAKINRRARLELVRQCVESMPTESQERLVAVRFMYDYSELDIRDELQITRVALLEAKRRIKQQLLNAGVTITIEVI